MKFKLNLDKFGVIGLFITVLFSPCCFPLFSFGASILGLGSFELFGGWTMWVFLIMVLLSILGLYISYLKHASLRPLIIAAPSALLIFFGFITNSNIQFIYTGMFGILIATGINYYQNKVYGKCNNCTKDISTTVVLKSTITCPNCEFQKEEIMPTDACQFFYDCENCKRILKPLEGDCCVYCSYGSIKCPPIQLGAICC